MALQDIYKSFLAHPVSHSLNDNASLHYITTLTTINTSAAIAKHNTAHQKVLKKKEEKILNCVEGANALCLDVETTIEFLSGGGAYLPGLDDNFVADRTVIFPVIHIVQFDPQQRIQQVRLYWDQGSLLKQIDVIGARARSWPIRDGKDQARLIATSASAHEDGSRPSTAASGSAARDSGIAGKPRSESNNVTRDPHASLALFGPRDEDDESSGPRAIAPKASAKPPPRDYQDLFVGNESDASPGAKNRSRSPQKGNGGMHQKAQSAKPPPRDYHDLFVGEESPKAPARGAPSPSKEAILSPPTGGKSGAGKNYKPSRLFETDDDVFVTPGSPQKGNYVKPHPTKYNHFEFGNGDDAPAPRTDRPKTKHQSQWDFEDFATPQQPKARSRPGDQDKRHFGWDDDESLMDSPAKHPAVAKARPDAAANFAFQDDGTPAGDRHRAGNALGGTNVRTTGLYQNNIVSDDDQLVPAPDKKSNPLSTVTNLKDRRKDFAPQFDMNDSSPSQTEQKKSIPEARAKVVNHMGASWEMTDSSTPPSSNKGNGRILSSMSDKENVAHGRGNSSVGIKSAGDGMGGKKGAGRSWGFGDDSDGEENVQKFQAGKKQQRPQDSGIWDF